MNKIAQKIQNRIKEQTNNDKARWLENYVKQNIKSRGVGIPTIRNIIKDEVKKNDLLESGLEEQIFVLNDLMS